MKTIAFFNNKGGVGKTTLVYHLAWIFADMGKRVLVADLDPQANLTSMFLSEGDLEQIWDGEDNTNLSIMNALEPLIKGLGDIGKTPTKKISSHLQLIPGDLRLSNFEAKLSDNWTKCLDRDESAFRITSSLFRLIQNAAKDNDAEIILIDVGPNFGAINRSALLCADEVVVPLAPDLFSIQALRNLGPTLKNWRLEWDDRKQRNPEPSLSLPQGLMQPLGYVIMQFGIRDNRPVKAYDQWSSRIAPTYQSYLTEDSNQDQEAASGNNHCLGLLKHYRSLMPMAMEARKPIFHLKSADGAIGSHMSGVKACEDDFTLLANSILNHI